MAHIEQFSCEITPEVSLNGVRLDVRVVADGKVYEQRHHLAYNYAVMLKDDDFHPLFHRLFRVMEANLKAVFDNLKDEEQKIPALVRIAHEMQK